MSELSKLLGGLYEVTYRGIYVRGKRKTTPLTPNEVAVTILPQFPDLTLSAAVDSVTSWQKACLETVAIAAKIESESHSAGVGTTKECLMIWDNYLCGWHGDRQGLYQRVPEKDGTVYRFVTVRGGQKDQGILWAMLSNTEMLHNAYAAACERTREEMLALPNPEKKGLKVVTLPDGSMDVHWEMTPAEWVSATYDAWLVTHAKTTSKPTTIFKITNSAKEPALCYIDLNKLRYSASDPIDAWLQFENQMDESLRPIFRAWMFSLADAENCHRQALWTEDSGFTGKSAVASALAGWLGNELVCAPTYKQLEKEFVGGMLANAWLVMAADNKSENLLQMGIIHSLLGGDRISAERKNQDAATIQLFSRVWVGSNIPPRVESHRVSEVSRVLPIPLIRNQTGEHIIGGQLAGNNHYPKKLLSQLNAYMGFCRKYYEEACPTRNNILLTDDQKHRMFMNVTSDDTLKDYIKDAYEVTKNVNDVVRRSDIDKACRKNVEDNRHIYSHAIRVLQTFDGVTLGEKEGVKVVCGIKHKRNTSAMTFGIGGKS